jgi:hypothetical protein
MEFSFLVLGLEVITAVFMNAAIFSNIVLCSPYVNRRFRGMYYLHVQGRKSAEQQSSVEQVATLRYIPEDGNIQVCSVYPPDFLPTSVQHVGPPRLK